MPEILPAFNRKTSALNLMCRVKLITFRTGKKYRMCCPHCGIAQREPHPSPELEYPFAIAQVAVSRDASGICSRGWSWESHPKPEQIPKPGQIYLLAGFEDDDKAKLEAIMADLSSFPGRGDIAFPAMYSCLILPAFPFNSVLIPGYFSPVY